FLAGLSGGAAGSLGPEGPEEARGPDGSGPGQSVQQGEGGRGVGPRGPGPRRGALRAGPRSGGGARPPAARGRASAFGRASLRVVRTSAERPWGARNKRARVARRVRGAAGRGGPRLRKAPPIAGAVSCPPCRTWGPAVGRARGKRCGSRTGSPPRRRRC